MIEDTASKNVNIKLLVDAASNASHLYKNTILFL